MLSDIVFKAWAAPCLVVAIPVGLLYVWERFSQPPKKRTIQRRSGPAFWRLLAISAYLLFLHLQPVQSFLFGEEAELTQLFGIEVIVFGTIGFLAFDLGYLSAVNRIKATVTDMEDAGKKKRIRNRLHGLRVDWVAFQFGHTIVYGFVLSFVSWLGAFGLDSSKAGPLGAIWLIALIVYALHLPTIQQDTRDMFPA